MMNRKTLKKAAVALMAFSLASFSVFPIFAHGEKRQRNREPFSRPLMTQEQMQIAGDWTYFDNNYLVKIDFDRDGDMEIKLREGNLSETEWEGFWTATANQITFNVVKKEVKDYTNASRRKTTERLFENWTINYSFDSNGALLLSCENLPSQVASGTAYQRSW